MPDQLERDVAAQTRDLLERRRDARRGKFRFWRVPLGPVKTRNQFAAKNPMAGFPDWMMTDQRWGGRMAFVELKRPGAPKRENEAKQNEIIAFLELCGVPVLRTDNVQAVVNFLASLDGEYQCY